MVGARDHEDNWCPLYAGHANASQHIVAQ